MSSQQPEAEKWNWSKILRWTQNDEEEKRRDWEWREKRNGNDKQKKISRQDEGVLCEKCDG